MWSLPTLGRAVPRTCVVTILQSGSRSAARSGAVVHGSNPTRRLTCDDHGNFFRLGRACCLAAPRCRIGVSTWSFWVPIRAHCTCGGLRPRASLGRHPSENEIVNEAMNHHAARLLAQIGAASPELIITLGNAATRVVAGLAGQRERGASLRPDSYGQARTVVLDRRRYEWQALVHPAPPREWAARHSVWLQSRS